jgi:hypothetical protein
MRPARPTILAGLAALVLAACGGTTVSTSTPVTTPTPTASAPRPAPATLGCAWYSPAGQGGQVVNVTATGPACQSLAALLAAATGRPWTTESVIPGSFGTLLATEHHDGSVASVWFTGQLPAATTTGSPPESTQTATPAAVLAGQVADDLQARGWSPQPAQS